MPKVRVPRKNVTPDEVVAVLSRRLGPGYQVEANGGRRVTDGRIGGVQMEPGQVVGAVAPASL